MKKQTSLYMEIADLEKLRFIADYEGFSINQQMRHLAKRVIREFEKEHGEIEVK